MSAFPGHKLNDCPMCGTRTRRPYCCGIALNERRPWRMTPALVRTVHVIARAKKGLTEEEYRMRLGAVGARTSLEFSRGQFHAFMAGLRKLPDVVRRAG